MYIHALNAWCNVSIILPAKAQFINPLTTGAAYIRVFIFYQHIRYRIKDMLKIKCDINKEDLKKVHLHFVKSE